MRSFNMRINKETSLTPINTFFRFYSLNSLKSFGFSICLHPSAACHGSVRLSNNSMTHGKAGTQSGTLDWKLPTFSHPYEVEEFQHLTDRWGGAVICFKKMTRQSNIPKMLFK